MRGGGVGRDLQVLEVEARDLLEGRRGDDAAPDRAARLVDRDQDDEARPRRGDDPDERGDVPAGGVAAVRIRLLRGPVFPATW